MKPNRICSTVSALFLAVFMFFSGALPAKAAAALFDPANFVLVRGGEFTMGSPEPEFGRSTDETQHQVKVSDFYMDKYAVTVAEFRRFVEATGYRTDAEKNGCSVIIFRGKIIPGDGKKWRHGVSESRRPLSEQNHPVLHVSWNDAVAYCEWLSKQTGKKFRLPMEAEWEYACRAGTTTPFNTGENLTTDQANYDGDNNNPKGAYRQNTLAVNRFEPNAWGLYNMHGNVWEWCSDWYSGTYYNDCKAKGVVENPSGPVTGLSRVTRGGSWIDRAEDCRSANRFDFPPVTRGFFMGFRLVFVP